MPKTPRGFVPLDMHYPRNAKIRRAGEAAELLFLRSIAYCKAGQTDGHIPDYDLEVAGVGLKGLERRVETLVRVGLWSEVHGGWNIPSWSAWNSSQEEIEQGRQKKRDAAILTNHRRYHDGRPDADCPHCEKKVTPLKKREAQ